MIATHSLHHSDEGFFGCQNLLPCRGSALLCGRLVQFHTNFHNKKYQRAYNFEMQKNARSQFIGVYLRFLELTSAVEALPGMDFFDPNHKALFEAILLRWSQGQAMTVREAIHLAQLGSPATLHKRLVRLRKANLIAVKSIESDRRTKLLVPTEQGLDYVSHFGHRLTQAGLDNASTQRA